MKIKKSKLRSLALGSLCYFILIDSGGPIGIRNISILFFCITSIFFIFSKFPKKLFLLDLSILLLILVGLLSAIFNNINIISFLHWIYFLGFIIIISKSLALFSENEIMKSLIIAGYLFVLSIIMVYLSFLFKTSFISKIILSNISKFPGWFQTINFWGIKYIQVYFQATLMLSTLSIIAFIYRKRLAFYLFSIILGMVLSRFGVFTVLFFVLIIKILGIKKFAKIIALYFIPVSIIIILIYFTIYLNIEHYIPTNTSLNIRLGHLISTFDSFNWLNFIFGQGAGSTFYSIGVNKIVDNTELSQLEFLRKFGIIGYMLFHIIVDLIFIYLYKIQKYELVIIIFSYYFVSLSNPVLTSVSFSFLLAIGISLIYKHNRMIHYIGENSVEQ